MIEASRERVKEVGIMGEASSEAKRRMEGCLLWKKAV